jgi:hypothetical protein
LETEVEEINIIGYWNGDENEWSFSKRRDAEHDILVEICFEEVPQPKVNPADKIRRSAKKVSRELRNYIRDIKKFK